MPQYRIEVSPNNRAGCKDKVCKDNAEKITKGTIRFGTWVEIQDHASWQWKHWGCVSGAQMVSCQELCDKGDGTYDFDAIDGYDELEDHPELQEKIRRCVKQGHIDAEDFKGDPEKNKPGEKGIHLTAKQKEKKEKEAQEAEESEEEKPKKKTTKRRKATDEDDVEDEPKSKKTKKAKTSKATKGAKAEYEDEDEKPAPAKKSRAAKSSSKKAKEEHEAENEEPAPKKKRQSTTGSKAKRASSSKGTVNEGVTEVPSKRRGRPRMP